MTEMQPQPRTTISQRLGWQLGVIAGVMAIMLLVSGIATLIILRLVLSATNERAVAQEQARIAYQLRGDVLGHTAALLDMMWSKVDRTADLAGYEAAIREHLAQAKASNLTDDQRQTLIALETQIEEYLPTANRMVESSKLGDDFQVAIRWTSGKGSAKKAYEEADKYNASQQAAADAALQRAQATSALALPLQLLTLLLALGVGLLVATSVSRRIVGALNTLTGAAQRVTSGDLSPVTLDRQDELGTLAAAFNAMVVEIDADRKALEQFNQQLEHRVAERTAELEQALEQQQALGEMVRGLSTPALPVLKGVLVIPLVGILDEQRIEMVQDTLLHSITQTHTHTAILDITGVPLVDSDVARALIEIVRQCRLLGAETLLVGISPDVAESLVSLGIDLRELTTLPTLQAAVRETLQKHSHSSLT